MFNEQCMNQTSHATYSCPLGHFVNALAIAPRMWGEYSVFIPRVHLVLFRQLQRTSLAVVRGDEDWRLERRGKTH